jgi:hypothetical protein
MFLKNAQTGDLTEVLDLKALFDPTEENVTVKYQAGEEVGDPVSVAKAELVFPSGESLPRCWLDPHYRVHF